MCFTESATFIEHLRYSLVAEFATRNLTGDRPTFRNEPFYLGDIADL